MTCQVSRWQSSIVVPRTACFTRGTADALVLKQRSPKPSSNGVIAGFAAISPHTETGIRCRPAASTVNWISRSIAGCSGS